MPDISSSTSKAAKATQKGYSSQMTYTTKQVESSIVLLDSLEDQIVAEALLYLSEYADIDKNNLYFLQQRGLLQKLLNLFNRNTRMLRVILRFLGILLCIDEVRQEIDQEIYYDKVMEIYRMYVTITDLHIKQFCVSILLQLTHSPRIMSMMFKLEFLKPILDTINKPPDADLLERTLELFKRLLKTSIAMEVLSKATEYDVLGLMKHLKSSEERIVLLTFEVICNLTSFSLNHFQEQFRKAKLIESMLDVLINPEKKKYHVLAIDVILNSIRSEETSDYFVESLQFLDFCQWVKTCDESYLLPCILILEHLTRIPYRKQILFDFSVEETILSCLRSKNRKVLNKTCLTISNMTAHKYCCEKMLTPTLMKSLFTIMLHKDEADPENDAALKTMLEFSTRNVNTVDILHEIGAIKILLNYIKKGLDNFSEENYLGLLKILQNMSMHALYQQDVACSSFYERLLTLFETAPLNIAVVATEIMTNFLRFPNFIIAFQAFNGPYLFVEKLRKSRSVRILSNILHFIYNILGNEKLITSFFKNRLIDALKRFPTSLKMKVPIADKVLRLIYKIHLPLKFYEQKRLDITDKLGDKFYLIRGRWKSSFPFLEDLIDVPINPSCVIYVVDFSFALLKFGDETSETSESITPRKISSERTMSTLSRFSSSLSSYFRRSPYQLNYGKLSSDPFLPRYVYHVSKYLLHAATFRDKIKILAQYIDVMLCGPTEGYAKLEKIHNLKLHVEVLKHKLGSGLIPVGFLRLGSYCERALLFKAMGDKCCIPTTLVKGNDERYWNEVMLTDSQAEDNIFSMYVVDLMNNVGNVMLVGSREANEYCNITGYV